MASRTDLDVGCKVYHEGVGLIEGRSARYILSISQTS